MLMHLYNILANPFKLALSQAASGTFWLPRRPIGPFATPLEAWQYLEARYTFTGDKLFGLKVDFYMDPLKFQYMLEQGKAFAAKFPIDCDDVASWSFIALSTVPGCKPQVKVLYDAPPFFRGCHCICVYELDGTFGSIDTNGHHTLPDLSDATLCKTWSDIYYTQGFRYQEAVTVNSPH